MATTAAGSLPLLPDRGQLRPAWASRLHSVRTDRAYQGRFVRPVQARGWQHEVASRPPSAERGFMAVAQRWGVERPFAGLNGFRRLVRASERQPARHAEWLVVANLTMSLRRAANA